MNALNFMFRVLALIAFFGVLIGVPIAYYLIDGRRNAKAKRAQFEQAHHVTIMEEPAIREDAVGATTTVLNSSTLYDWAESA